MFKSNVVIIKAQESFQNTAKLYGLSSLRTKLLEIWFIKNLLRHPEMYSLTKWIINIKRVEIYVNLPPFKYLECVRKEK